MKPEIQGRLMVAMFVSIIAFGFGTGTILITGQLPNLDSTNMFNNTQNSDLPVIYDTNQNNMDTSDTPSTPDTPSTTPSTTTDGQTGGQDNQNDNPTSANNTTN
jgi:hypothetical protein